MTAPAASPLRWTPASATAALAALGALMAASYLYAARAQMTDIFTLQNVALVQALLFLGSAGIVLRARTGRPTLAIILLVGILCRAPLVFAPPLFSSDVYRYVWDGRVQAAGINPYRYVPADPALARLRDAAIYPHINRRDYAPTIYPPAAQVIFLAVTRVSETVAAMKAAMVAFEAIAVWMLSPLLGRLGLPRERILLYAWHPLAIWQVAGGGHIDAAAIAFIAIALLAHTRRSEAVTGIALACATLVKWYPALLFPALYRPRGWKMPAAMAATMVAGYLPYLGVGAGVLGFLPGYASEEGLLNGNRFFLVNLARLAGAVVPARAYIGAAVAVLMVIAYATVSARRRTALGDISHAQTLATALIVLFSPNYLWYFAWLTLFLALVPTVPALFLTSAATYLYSALGTHPFLGVYAQVLFNLALYVPFALLALGLWRRAAATRRVARPGPPPLRPAGDLRADADGIELARKET